MLKTMLKMSFFNSGNSKDVDHSNMHYLYIVLSSIQGHLLRVKGLGIEQGY